VTNRRPVYFARRMKVLFAEDFLTIGALGAGVVKVS
jgi:hypothetical protein